MTVYDGAMDLDEIRAVYGDGTPIAAAWEWLENLQHERWPEAWAACSEGHRRRAVSMALALPKDPESFQAGRFERAVKEGPRSTAWHSIARAWGAALRALLGGYNPETWGALSRPRVLAPGVEQVLLVPLSAVPGGGRSFPEDTPLPDAIMIDMVHTADGWRVDTITRKRLQR